MAIKSVGANLREAREKQGSTLHDIGARTRITVKCLTAIEDDDVTKLSSPFFYRSFVRQFAEQVGLDYQQLSVGVEKLAANMREPDLPGQGEYPPVRIAPLQPRIKRDFSWVSPVLLFVAAVGVITSGYAAWRYQPEWLNSTPVGSFVRSLKASQSGNEGGAAIADHPKAAVPGNDSKPPSDEDATDASGAKATDDSSLASDTPPADAPPLPGSKAPAVAGITATIVPDNAQRTDAGIHLEVAATERTWLSVTADGRPAYSGILEKEEVKVLDGQETAELRTGNAAGVNITFNGRQIGALGPRGTTRRVIFTKTSFEVVSKSHHPQFARATHIGG
jgi:cytoskeleton protein RodZ